MSRRLKSFELVASGEYDKNNKRFVLDKYLSLDGDAVYYFSINVNLGSLGQPDGVFTYQLVVPSENNKHKYSVVGLRWGAYGGAVGQVYNSDNPDGSNYILVEASNSIIDDADKDTIYIYRLS